MKHFYSTARRSTLALGLPLLLGACADDRVLQLALVALLVTGCWLVLEPFFTAIMFCAVVGVSTWPAYEWLLRRLRGRMRAWARVVR